MPWHPVDDGSHYEGNVGTVERVFYGGKPPAPPQKAKRAAKPRRLGTQAAVLAQLRDGARDAQELSDALPTRSLPAIRDALAVLVAARRITRNAHTGRYQIPFGAAR